MLIYLPGSFNEAAVQQAISALRHAHVIARSGEVVRSAGQIQGGVIVLENDNEIPTALNALTRLVGVTDGMQQFGVLRRRGDP